MKRGFTLIELLVVISIIGLLSSIVLTSLGVSRSKARDAVRKSDVRQIANSVEQYYVDKGDLPQWTGWCTTISNSQYGQKSCPSPESGKGCFQDQISPYMPKVSLDPTRSVAAVDNYFYYNIKDTGRFTVCAQLENPTGKSYPYGPGSPKSCIATTPTYNYCLEIQ
jgi:prepilin-type N-terminal cleavage/methylation domain-containing protein